MISKIVRKWRRCSKRARRMSKRPKKKAKLNSTTPWMASRMIWRGPSATGIEKRRSSMQNTRMNLTC